MNVLLFGASGMVGQGVLRECLLDPAVQQVQTIGRSSPTVQHAKLRNTVHADLWNYSSLETQLSGYDACFFCLGVSSGGMKEADYDRITYGITLAAAETLSRLNPGMTFIYVSGQGTDTSERGLIMWARVKGRTENALFRLPFKAVYAFRPGLIQPLYGAVSKTRAYRLIYPLLGPVLPLLRRIFPNAVTTTEQIGRAMLAVAKHGAPRRVLETSDINGVA